MSVLIVDLKVYSYVHQGLVKVAFLTECTEFYSSRINEYFRGFDTNVEAERIVKNWLTLNERSYHIEYNEDSNETLVHFLEVKAGDNLTALQFLKYLTAIKYNIETEAIRTDRDKFDFNILNDLIEDIKDSIIGNIAEYKNAKWSSYE